MGQFEKPMTEAVCLVRFLKTYKAELHQSAEDSMERGFRKTRFPSQIGEAERTVTRTDELKHGQALGKGRGPSRQVAFVDSSDWLSIQHGRPQLSAVSDAGSNKCKWSGLKVKGSGVPSSIRPTFMRRAIIVFARRSSSWTANVASRTAFSSGTGK